MISKYGKSHERECISCFMGPSDILIDHHKSIILYLHLSLHNELQLPLSNLWKTPLIHVTANFEKIILC